MSPFDAERERAQALFHAEFAAFLRRHGREEWARSHERSAEQHLARLRLRGEAAVLTALAQQALELAQQALAEDERVEGGHAHSLRGAIRCLEHAAGRRS